MDMNDNVLVIGGDFDLQTISRRDYEMLQQIERARTRRVLVSILHYTTLAMLLCCIACACYLVGTGAVPIAPTLIAILVMIWFAGMIQTAHVSNRN